MKTNGTKILVVDDEAGYRKVLYNALTERGYQVLTAACGEDALKELTASNSLKGQKNCITPPYC